MDNFSHSHIVKHVLHCWKFKVQYNDIYFTYISIWMHLSNPPQPQAAIGVSLYFQHHDKISGS